MQTRILWRNEPKQSSIRNYGRARAKLLGSARVSRVGFGVAPEQSSLNRFTRGRARLNGKFAIARTSSVRAGLALSGEADPRVEALVRKSVSFLLALRGAFR